MGSAKLALTLGIFAAVGVILLGIVAPVVADHTGEQSVTNETVNADYNNSVDLQGYDITKGTVTVYGFNDTSDKYEVASDPGDYDIKYAPGEITFNSSSSLIQDGEEVKVTYDYTAAGPTASLVIGFIPVALALIIFTGVARAVEGVM